MKRRTSRRPRAATHRFMTETEYRELIQMFVDRARADQAIADRLTEEARERFGLKIDTSGEDG